MFRKLKNVMKIVFALVIVSVLALLVILSINFLYYEKIYSERAKDNSHYREDKLKIFIYDWDEELIILKPKGFSHVKRLSFEDGHYLNNGAGKKFERQINLYNTHQYSLFLLFYHRLKKLEEIQQPLITKNPSEATHFFIPYDIGMDSTTRRSDGALTLTNCPLRNTVSNLLKNSPAFVHSHGKNHFMINSINQMMFFFLNKECREFFQLCINCTKFSIDTYNHELYPELSQLPEMTSRWISVPFPSNYHLHLNGAVEESELPWIRTLQLIERNYSEYLRDRKHSIAFAGSLQVTAKKQRLLRKMILEECAKHRSALCLELRSHSSSTQLRDHKLQPSTSTDSSHPMYPYTVARFCLQPGGDFPTRKGLLDALLSGCIPVVFQRQAATLQWRTHWRTDLSADDCLVFFPLSQALRNISLVFEELLRRSEEKHFLVNKLHCIAAHGLRMQYSIFDTSSKDSRERYNNLASLDAFSLAIASLQTE